MSRPFVLACLGLVVAPTAWAQSVPPPNSTAAAPSPAQRIAQQGLADPLPALPPPPTVPPEPAPTPTPTTALAERVVVDQLGGGANRGAWGVSLQGGFPFFTLRGQLGLARGASTIAELETALGRRFNASLGLSLAWLRRPRIRLTGEVLLGWMLQESELPRRGPSGELRLRLVIPTRWVVPYLVLGTRHAFLPNRTQIERESTTDTLWTVRHEWTPTGSLGLGIHIHRHVGLDLGVDYGWVDAPVSVALPGFHLGVHVGGGR
ncbi:MAG TPA: hypothetical protein PKI03_11080 [Pseudomonadota bacterium]|nr:hypothetical protein [Pseudomonadota bacterium]